ncbi:Uncharacterised protein [Kluyvera cryocrescens]|uniref:Uncharacterized protein n=1 Tax=Kluyvera cryocrescens TaxID=580 RepID=A0A485AKB3_KLUCR|nr:Uncharacterised protein [Kluyvera cryocrescens]
MCKDQRCSVDFDGFSYNFARMNLNMAQRTGKKAAVFEDFVLAIEKDNQKGSLVLHPPVGFAKTPASSPA